MARKLSSIKGTTLKTSSDAPGISTSKNLVIGSDKIAHAVSATDFPLQVSGGAYISGSAGIGTTNPTSKLHVAGDANITGVVTATSFSGDGSQLTNLSGMGVAAGPTGFGVDVFYTNTVGYVSATTTIASVDASLAPILYTRYQEVVIDDGFDLIIGTGNDLLLNVFQLS